MCLTPKFQNWFRFGEIFFLKHSSLLPDVINCKTMGSSVEKVYIFSPLPEGFSNKIKLLGKIGNIARN